MPRDATGWCERSSFVSLCVLTLTLTPTPTRGACWLLRQVVVFKTAAVAQLIDVLAHGPPSVREQAAGALINLAITDRGWCQEGWLVASASEVEALVRMLQLEAVASTPGVADAKGAVRQLMALLEQLLMDVAEFRYSES